MIVITPLKKWREVSVTIYGPTYINDEVRIGRGTKIGAFCDNGC